MGRPQIRNLKVEFLLLVIVICFDSLPQLFQLFNHYKKQGKIPRLQPRNLFTKQTTIHYMHRLTEEYPDEYKGDEYNLIHSSVPTNINYIHRLCGTDEHNYLYSLVPCNRQTYWRAHVAICHGHMAFIFLG
jgi:hypothetical protein